MAEVATTIKTMDIVFANGFVSSLISMRLNLSRIYIAINGRMMVKCMLVVNVAHNWTLPSDPDRTPNPEAPP